MKALSLNTSIKGSEILTALEYANLASKASNVLYVVVDDTASATVTIGAAYVGSIEQDILIGNDDSIIYLKEGFTGHTNGTVDLFNIV